MRRLVLVCLVTVFARGGHALPADPSLVGPGRLEAGRLTAFERTGLRLRILLAQGALLELRKNKWILDKLGTPGRSTVLNFGLGVGAMALDSFVLTYAIDWLTDESRASLHADVREVYRSIDAAQTELLALRKRHYGTGRPGGVPERTPELVAQLADAEERVATLMERRSTVGLRPWQRPARAVRFTLAYGLGAVLVVDTLGTFAQVALDPLAGEQIADKLNAYIWEAKETLHRTHAD